MTCFTLSAKMQVDFAVFKFVVGLYFTLWEEEIFVKRPCHFHSLVVQAEIELMSRTIYHSEEAKYTLEASNTHQKLGFGEEKLNCPLWPTFAVCRIRGVP